MRCCDYLLFSQELICPFLSDSSKDVIGVPQQALFETLHDPSMLADRRGGGQLLVTGVNNRAKVYCACSRWGCLGIFLSSIFFSF